MNDRPTSIAVELAEHLLATPLPARPSWASTPHLAHGEHRYDGACAICRTADRQALPVVVQAVLDRLAEAGRGDATTSPLCPRCYSEGRDGCCLALEWRRTRAAAEGAPDPDDAGLPLWQQVDRGWSRRYDADYRAWQRERDQSRAEVESLRATVRGLTSQTQAYVDRAAAEGARIVELTMERDAARLQVAELSASRAEAAGRLLAARGARDAARAELDRLRGMLREIAIARRGDCPDVDRDHDELPDEIRSDHAHARRQAEEIERMRSELESMTELLVEKNSEIGRLRAAIPDDIDPAHIRPMLRLLGPTRLVFDQLAEALSGQAGPWGRDAAEMAQRIVDWIGHPSTDEPAWATLPCEHAGACGTCRPCQARVRAGYRAGLVDGAPVIAEREDGQP